MRIPDVNVLIHSVNQKSPRHEEARSWLREALSEPNVLGLPWMSLAGFLRLSTDPHVLADALSPANSLSVVDDWLSNPNTRQIAPGSQHLSILGRLMIEHSVKGRDTTDARFAAIAIEHNATFATFDSDFHRFAELDLEYLGAR